MYNSVQGHRHGGCMMCTLCTATYVAHRLATCIATYLLFNKGNGFGVGSLSECAPLVIGAIHFMCLHSSGHRLFLLLG